MNDDKLDDLKQFIASTVTQTEQRLRDELASKDDLQSLRVELKAGIDNVRTEMADGFAGVGEAIESLHQTNTSVDQRLNRLEQQAA